ncbi:unnamed protein product [Oncorhynchus mykiss]|uniref:Uncharacterized protein n=1 Tax=Oncorhynchus mykiss TaxID=8022 RepID=A0A060XXC9_ONCMY|nr:unnamed protein product [Oncorhynchus mykiss]
MLEMYTSIYREICQYHPAPLLTVSLIQFLVTLVQSNRVLGMKRKMQVI